MKGQSNVGGWLMIHLTECKLVFIAEPMQHVVAAGSSDTIVLHWSAVLASGFRDYTTLLEF